MLIIQIGIVERIKRRTLSSYIQKKEKKERRGFVIKPKIKGERKICSCDIDPLTSVTDVIIVYFPIELKINSVK